MVQPEAWPSLVAEATTLIRENLTNYNDKVEVSQVISLMLADRDMGTYDARTNDPLVGELVWAVREAIRTLEAEAELRGIGSNSPPSVRIMWQEVGFDTTIVNDYRIPQWVVATPKRVQLAEYVEITDIKWEAVRRLLAEVRRAHLHGLEVVSLVGARIAAEESVKSALADLGVPQDQQPDRAWQREDRLFEDHLTSNAGFAPMDRTSTRSLLSTVRDSGNDAAHTGQAQNAHLNELLTSVLPRALVSLSAAVEHQL
jgi:hypothetical protein